MTAHTCTKHEPGTPVCYRDCRCRCRQCGSAQYRYEVLRQLDPSPRRIPSHGVRRRVQALMRLGWAETRLSVLCGWGESTLHAALRRRYVSPRTHQVITALYDRLWDTPPTPSTPSERMVDTRNRRRAEREGWAPPLAWDDGAGPHGIDNPKARPHPWKRRDNESRSRHDISDLRAVGLADTEIAHHLGIQPESLQRRHAA